MPEKPDLFKEELDQLSDEEIEARLAAAVWVDDKRAAVLRYLEEKKLGKKNEARSAELEIARSAKEAAWAAASMAKEANRSAKPRHHNRERGSGSSHLSSSHRLGQLVY